MAKPKTIIMKLGEHGQLCCHSWFNFIDFYISDCGETDITYTHGNHTKRIVIGGLRMILKRLMSIFLVA